MSAEHSPESVAGTAHKRGLGSRALRAVGAMILTAAAAVGAWMVFRSLDRIEQSGEEYQRWGGALRWCTMGACIVVAACSVFMWDIEYRGLRAACRFGAIAAALSLLLALGPVPGGFLAGLLLMIAAARFAVAALTPTAEFLRAVNRNLPMRICAAAAIAAFLCASAAMCAMKLNGLGWAFGVD